MFRKPGYYIKGFIFDNYHAYFIFDENSIMDKEVALIIAEMLIKQDETIAHIKDLTINVQNVTTNKRN